MVVSVALFLLIAILSPNYKLLNAMSKKNYLLALVAGFAVLVAGCTKPDAQKPDSGNEPDKITSADFVGTWGQGEDTDMLVLKEDGTFSEKGWEETISGKWSYNENDSTITMTPDGGDARTMNVLLIGGKAWLVLIEENGEGEYKFRFANSYRKAGATVKSAPLGDGRWDAPHGGVKPAEYNEDADYSMCLVVAGNNIDMYVPMWGYHIQGTFTLENGHLQITTDDDHIWAGKQISFQDSDHWSFGWMAWSEEGDCHSMNPETFELVGYTWYSVNQLKRMGHAPVDSSDYTFEARIWEAAVQIHDEAMELCSFDLCVTDDGKDAYAGPSVGLIPWFYKR